MKASKKKTISAALALNFGFQCDIEDCQTKLFSVFDQQIVNFVSFKAAKYKTGIFNLHFKRQEKRDALTMKYSKRKGGLKTNYLLN